MKEILKKHYDKAILAALALCFIMALLYLLQMLETAKSITESDLRFQAPRRKYEVQNFADKKYDISHQLGERTVWNNRVDSSNMGFTAELAVPMEAVRCPEESCKKILPVAIARDKKACPFCTAKLDDPETNEYQNQIQSKDSDEDGMPDRYERRMGFKIDDPKDAEEDRDGDGFSNLYEFLSETNPNDPTSYPSLHKCLYLYRFKRDLMKLKLNSVIKVADPADANSKKNWMISLTVNKDTMPQMFSVGNTFKVENTTYKIVDANYDTTNKKAEKAETLLVSADKASITIVPLIDGKPDPAGQMVIKLGEKVYKPLQIAVIRDVRKSNKVHEVRKGETFQITSEEKEKVRFFVKDVDVKNAKVIIEDVDKGEVFELPKRSLIKNAYVKKDESNTSSTPRRTRTNKKRRR